MFLPRYQCGLKGSTHLGGSLPGSKVVELYGWEALGKLGPCRGLSVLAGKTTKAQVGVLRNSFVLGYRQVESTSSSIPPVCSICTFVPTVTLLTPMLDPKGIVC